MMTELHIIPNTINKFYRTHLYSSLLLRLIVALMAVPSLLFVFPEIITFLLTSIILLFSNMWMIGILVTLSFILYISMIVATWYYIKQNQSSSAQFVLMYLTEMIVIIPVCITFLSKF